MAVKTKTPKLGIKTIDIKGVVISSPPLYVAGPYGVFVGYIESDNNRDIPHYLLVNTDHGVVEGSSARIFEARGMCDAFAMELKAQDETLAKGMAIVEKQEPNGNVDPEYQEKVRKWKSH